MGYLWATDRPGYIQVLFKLIILTVQSKHDYYPHFIDEKIEA